MRQRKLLIISPDQDLVGALQQALRGLQRRGSASILRQYPTPEQLDGILHHEHPSSVVIGLHDQTMALSLIEHLHQAWPELVVAGAHTALDSSLIVAAHRAGAREFLTPPVDLEVLESLLSSVPDDDSEAQPGRLISCLPARGGCGSSTVALHLAAALAQASHGRVLLVDFDFHTGSIAFRLKLLPKFTLLDALARPAELDELWDRIACRWGNLEVLVPPPRADFPPSLLQELPAVLHSARKNYSWVVCDLPVAIYASCLDAMAQAEMVYLICTLEVPAVQLAGRRIRELLDLGVPRDTIRLLINRMASSTPLQPAELEQLLGIRIACTLPNDYPEVNRAILEGRLIGAHSELGQRFDALAHQILGSPGGPRPQEHSAGWRTFLARLATGISRWPSTPPAAVPAPPASKLRKARP